METQSDKPFTFGRFLSGARLERGIDLSDISKMIKVNISTLHLIENGDHEKLPAPVFTKGFIRAYADAVGIDKKEILMLYEESYARYQNKRKAEADLAVYGKKFWRHLGSALGLLLLLITFSFFLLVEPGKETIEDTVKESSAPNQSEKEDASSNKEMETETPKDDGEKAPGGSPPLPIGQETATPTQAMNTIIEKFHLKITVVEDTRIKIIVDDESPKEMLLKRGDIKEMRAEKRFNILIGNATGIKLELDGKPIDIPGKSGQIATLMLP